MSCCPAHPDGRAHSTPHACDVPAFAAGEFVFAGAASLPAAVLLLLLLCCSVLAPRLKEVFPETAEQLLKRVSRRTMHIRKQSGLAALCFSSVAATRVQPFVVLKLLS